MTSEEVLALIPKARELGGKHLVAILELLSTLQEPFPLETLRALKIRGVGRQSLAYLKLLGLVESNKEGEPFFGLGTRAKGCLRNAKVEMKWQVSDRIRSGLLDPYSEKKLRQYGFKTHKEICRWAGIEPTPKPPVRGVHPNGNMNPERMRDASGNAYLMDAVFHDEEGNVYINGRKMNIEEAQKWASDILEACRHAEARKKSK